ncbi:hypothetical protein Premu_1964 [Hallella multisaccharivorax DSM 17128]|uniref:Uncharacterized protein n=1 Tax=Hallella multisaccharivorax DSM 17128 TaxID=688246 RepID=F8N748_9BACT|nr:hypothetical protein Premu_1964 [Hallella multisaccharivorax DSM 17128]
MHSRATMTASSLLFVNIMTLFGRIPAGHHLNRTAFTVKWQYDYS